MDNIAKLYIDFYSLTEVAIRPQLSVQYILAGEVMLTSAYIIRQLSNMRGTGVEEVLADGLEEGRDADLRTFDLGDYIVGRDIDIRMPSLVEHHGKGYKSFYASLDLVGSHQQPLPMLSLNVKGFGLLGKQVKYFAVQSVNALLRYYAIKYRDNEPFRLAFNDVAYACAVEFRSGIGRGASQARAVLRIAQFIFPKRN